MCEVEEMTIGYERQLFSRYQAAEEGLIRYSVWREGHVMVTGDHVIPYLQVRPW